MDAEAIVLLFVFATPGALFISAWDFFSRRHDRDRFSHLGFGLVASAIAYAFGFWVGGDDYVSVFDSEGEGVVLARLSEAANVKFFLNLCAGAILTGLVGSRLVHTDRFQEFFHWATGRTSYAATWPEVVAKATNVWVRVQTTSGDVWMGFIGRVPAVLGADDEFFTLEEPYLFVDGEWARQTFSPLALRLSDVRYIFMDCKGGGSE